MFPWIYGFHWSQGSIVFLGAFYCVVAVVAATLLFAFRRARRAVQVGRQEEIRWHSDFHDLPARDRQCRHMLTGEFAYRECPNAFDCRFCETHAHLLAGHPAAPPAESEEGILGMAFPIDRLYHRGHTWVKREPDGIVTVGLDELARRLVGTPDRVELPLPGTRLETNGTAWHLHKRGVDIRVLAPVDGEVVESRAQHGGSLRIKLACKGFNLRHLLTPAEVRPWLLREFDRLQLSLSGVPALADGGMPVDDISAQISKSDWDAACSEIFLQT